MSQLQHGVAAIYIRQNLIQAGWPSRTIDDSLNETLAHDAHILPCPIGYYPEVRQQPLRITPSPTASDASDNSEPYYLKTALYDGLQAIRHNIAAVTLANIVGFGFAVIYYRTLIAKLPVINDPIHDIRSAATFGVSIAAGLFLSNLIFCMLALAINDGMCNRRQPFGTVFVGSLQMIFRVIGSELLLAVSLLSPFVVGGVVLMAAEIVGGSVGFNSLAPVVLFAVFGWLTYGLQHFLLAPYVALFRPDIAIRRTLSHSSQLLRPGGAHIIVKGATILSLMAIIGAILTDIHSLSQLLLSADYPAFAILISLTTLTFGTMVALYDKRQASTLHSNYNQ